MKPSECIASIEQLMRECADIQARILAKKEVKVWEYRVVIKRVPEEPGVWLPATRVLGAGAPAVQPARAGHGPGLHMAGHHMAGHHMGMPQPAFLSQVKAPLFEVIEVPVVHKSTDILAKQSFDLDVEVIEDIFNDKINYGKVSYSRGAPMGTPPMTPAS